MKSSDHRKNWTGIVFLLIFIALAAGILAGGYFAYRNYEQNYRTEVERQLSAIAGSKVDQLVQWRKERIADGEVFFRNDAFSILVMRYLQNPNDLEAKRGILTWVGQVQRAYGYDLMMLFDAQFNTKLVFPEKRERARLVVDQRNTEILLSGNLAFQDFYRNEDDRRIYLNILVPILDNHSPKRMVAVLALRIDPTQNLYPMIEKWPTVSKTSETLIIRRDGNDALFLNNLKFRKDAALKLRIPLERKDVLGVEAALGMEGVVEGADYRGEHVIGNLRAVPNSPWFLVARMDYSEVYAPLRERLWLMIILVGALLAGAGASVGRIWRHQRNRFYLEQYKSAEALRDSENRYRRLFEAARDGILILNAETGEIVDVNPFLIEILGYPREMFIGKSLWEIGFFKDVAESKAHFLELQEKKYIRYKDLPLKTAKGKQINVEFVSNIYQVDHQSVAQCNIRDITERKSAEKTLSDSEVQYRRLFEAARDGVLILDAETEMITDVNPFLVEMLGYSREHFLGKRIWELGFFKDIAANKAKFLELLQKGCIRYEDLPLETGTGRLINVEFVSHVYQVNDKKVVQCNVRDITERKRIGTELRTLYDTSERSRLDLLSILEDQKKVEEEIQKLNAELETRVVERTAQLEAANKELEAFSYSVSHDLRAPLRAVDGFSRIVMEEYAQKLDPEAGRLLKVIISSTQKMDELITDLLELSRVGRNEMNLSRVAMGMLADFIYHETGTDEIRKKLSFSVAPIPDAYCDSVLIRQVWRNLISNAVKFTAPKEGGRIEIGGQIEEGNVVYFIRDTGVGFDPRYTHKLFGVFQRLHKAEEFEGTGVGLAIVQRIIQRHGGKVWAEGKVGEGATFWFSLPAREA